jgi:surface antigen
MKRIKVLTNKWFKRILIISITFTIIFAGVWIILQTKSEDNIGMELDKYKNVSVYYNGINFSKSYGKNYSTDGYYYGQKWQCVEFVKRFYFEAKGHKMPDVYGHAKDFFDENIAHGEINPKRGLVQYINGGDIRPEPDDLMVFTGFGYGHVAIVTKVGEDFIEVIQQNILGKPRDTHPLIKKENRYYVGESSSKPIGWLRTKFEKNSLEPSTLAYKVKNEGVKLYEAA